MFLSSALAAAAAVTSWTVLDAGHGDPTLGECAGVGVVVDYGQLDDVDTVVCLTTHATHMTGSEALTASGIQTEGTVRFPSFVCRVNGKPAPDQPVTTDHGTIYERCSVTPSAQAYWSVWTADTQGVWTYANLGVEGIVLTEGKAVGLVFHQGAGPVTGPGAEAWDRTARMVDAPTVPQEPTNAAPRESSPSAAVILLGGGALMMMIFLVVWRRRALQRRRD
ncbi:hypothetical protein [Jonesia quinghaiensis]|uniref:hypothetical protein n=1 Tax=Jonesia quinghaiensis TaxID=262806 RepID=UPI0003FE6412|nr:hypothetical protein [Jonesia quinghaiensis]